LAVVAMDAYLQQTHQVVMARPILEAEAELLMGPAREVMAGLVYVSSGILVGPGVAEAPSHHQVGTRTTHLRRQAHSWGNYMAHWAKVNNGVVVEVIVAEQDFFESFVDSSPGQWLETSYNTHGGVYYDPETNTPTSDQSKALRKNYAGIGYLYDAELDAFIPPRPGDEYTLNTTTCLWER
jgi:hypothetical protein